MSDFKDLMDKSIEPESREIINVDCKKAKEIFDKEAKDPEKLVLLVEAESETEAEEERIIEDEEERAGRPNFVTSLPKGTNWDDEEGEVVIMSERRLQKSLASGSKFADYVQKYGKEPEEGDEVMVAIDSDGIEQIQL